MRICLLYPPPWKIPLPGEAPDTNGDGPPGEFRDGDLDADFFQTPYGLFSLGAQAIRAGHQVKVFNLSAHAWSHVKDIVARLDAQVFGMSCWTANRRGVALVAKLIRSLHPRAHIVIGGPHATPLAREMLEHFPEIDTVVTGEGELSFLELLQRLQAGKSTTDIAGTVFRGTNGIEQGPPRASIENLDTLASPHQYFDTHIMMTSRGCPWACTFCGAETTWGRGFRGHSVEYVIDALAAVLPRLPVKMVQVKDDTFTANRKRATKIARAIRDRGLNFFWSCDTRVDVLSEELLYEMRLAGCQRLSLGVESGSPSILKNINKKISVEEIILATEMAKKYGVQVRYYMMLGNRGETAETFRETLEFLKAARPHQYIFSCLSIFPGTEDFYDAEREGWLDREIYFRGDFQELKTPFDASEADTALMNAWFYENSGLREYHRESVDECRAILGRLGDYHAAHMDLADAYFRERNLGGCEHHVQRALELGYPAPGIALNYLACIAYQRGDLETMQSRFLEAARRDPQHNVLVKNVERARTWFREGGAAKKIPLELEVRSDFQLLERTTQPTLPGPLPDDFDDFDHVPIAPAVFVPPDSQHVTPEGHDSVAFGRRLRVVQSG